MATPLSDERLAEIRERCDKATQGPWELEIKGADAAPLVIVWARYPHREGLHRHFITYTEYGEKPDPDVFQRNSDNYAFIAAARTDMPDLLAEVERLRALERDIYAALVAKQQEADRLAGDYVAIRAENQSLRDHHYDLRTEVARLRARNAELVAVLRSVEWGAGTWAYDYDGGRMIPTCPRCLGEKNYGHDDDCALDAALRASNE